jgi:hypothetical protein
MPRRPSELPDPLNDSQHLQLDNVEDLLSRLADREINRMIGPNGTQYDLVPLETDATHRPQVARATPVQAPNAQLDSFFGALHSRPAAPPAPAPVIVEPPQQPAISRVEIPPPPRTHIDHAHAEARSRQALIAPIEPPPNAIVRMFAWLNGPVLDMSPRGRAAVSLFSVLAFLGSLSALGYVLMLRHG